MDVKQAVSIAKSHLIDLFSDEGIINLGLEEVELDTSTNTWKITLGFSRPWDHKNTLVAALGNDGRPNRSYKVVRISDDDGSVMSLTDRVLDPSE